MHRVRGFPSPGTSHKCPFLHLSNHLPCVDESCLGVCFRGTPKSDVRTPRPLCLLQSLDPVCFRGSASCRQALSICTYYQKSYVVTGQIGTDFSARFDPSLPADRFENARGGKIRIKRIRSQRSRLPWSLPCSLWLKYGLLSTEQPCQG